MDFRPAAFKTHIVHICFHQLDAAPVFGIGIRCDAVTDCLFEVESLSLIRHDDGYFLAGLAAAAEVYFCVWIFLVTVDHSIFQRFPECQLDIELLSRKALRSFNQPHQAIYKR